MSFFGRVLMRKLPTRITIFKKIGTIYNCAPQKQNSKQKNDEEEIESRKQNFLPGKCQIMRLKFVIAGNNQV